MSTIKTNRLSNLDGSIDVGLEDLLVKPTSVENLGEYRSGVTLENRQQGLTLGDEVIILKPYQKSYTTTGNWEEDKEYLTKYSDPWNHQGLINRNKPNAHDASAIGFNYRGIATNVHATLNALLFKNTEEMKSAVDLKVGMIARTLGYYTPGDGGGSVYEIVEAGTGSNFGFLFEQLAGSGLDAKLLGGGIMEDKTAYIPTDYATLQEAIDALCIINSVNGSEIDIVIQSGHSPASGISITNKDASHLTISSEDPVVTLDMSFGRVDSFLRADYASAPKLNCLIDANTQAISGYRLDNSSKGFVYPACGVTNCWGTGLHVSSGSSCKAVDTNWTSNAVNGSTGSGILVLSATVDASGADVSDSYYYGAQASEGGILVFRNGNANRTGRYGLRARNGGVIDCEGATCSDNAMDGIRAFMGGRINARYITAQNNGNADIWASRNSQIEAGDATLGGINTVACVYAAAGSVVSANGSTMNGGERGLWAEKGSTISAGLSTISNMRVGCEAILGSQIDIERTEISTSTSRAIVCDNGSYVNASKAIITDAFEAARCTNGGQINLADSTCTNFSERGVFAFRGGSISCGGATIQKVSGTNTGGSLADINVASGGIIYAINATGGVNTTENTLSSSGIIFR